MSLSDELRTRCGLPRGRPTEAEVNRIASKLIRFENRIERPFTQADLREIALEVTGCDGSEFYKGQSFVEFHAVLSMLRTLAAEQNLSHMPTLKESLDAWFSFPFQHPTEAEVDQIANEVRSFEVTAGKAIEHHQLESIVRRLIPGTRVPRFDGQDFRDFAALLAALRTQVAKVRG